MCSRGRNNLRGGVWCYLSGGRLSGTTLTQAVRGRENSGAFAGSAPRSKALLEDSWLARRYRMLSPCCVVVRELCSQCCYTALTTRGSSP